MNAMGIEPFTLCNCSGCGTELTVPFELDYLTLEKPLYEKTIFTVYEGFDKSQNTSSMIFILPSDNPEFKKFYKIAKEQATFLATLKHPNVCPIINFGEIDGNFFVVEPRMDGFPLSDYSPEKLGLLEVEKVIDLLHSVAHGLAISHHKEFVHHDLCPKNIHVDARGIVRTKNFFISRFTYDYFQGREDIVSSVSSYSISPEKAESFVEDKRGDVFSFGVLFYYMLTGKYPFSGKNIMETVYSRIKRKKSSQEQVFSNEKSPVLTAGTIDYVAPVPPSSLRDGVPEEINTAVLEMLSYHPVQRPRFTEILSMINLYKAKGDREKVFHFAQKEMVRETINTKTKVIPNMKSLYDGPDPKKEEKDPPDPWTS
jgi:serine/threonine protein kinase